MKQTNAMETLVGAFVLTVAISFIGYAYKNSGSSTESTYVLSAQFHQANGLHDGSDVRIGGVKIGTIQSLSLDTKTLYPVVAFAVNTDIKIPKDSKASITSSSLMGDKYLELTPGGSDDDLQPGDVIYNTQDSVNLESLIGKAVFKAQD